MIKGLWNKAQIVCGCHEDIGITPKMALKEGHRSMFYSCPRYYPDAREATDTACINHLSSDDMEKLLELISDEYKNIMVFGQSQSLCGCVIKFKKITAKVIKDDPDELIISVVNKGALS